MPQLTIGDFTGSAQLDLAGTSQLSKFHILSLKTQITGLIDAFTGPVAGSKFTDAALGASFQDSSLPLTQGTLSIQAGINAKLALEQLSGDPLFGADDYDPIPTIEGDYSLSFELDTVVGGGASVPLPDGFGVSFNASAAPSFSTNLNIPKAAAANTTLRDATQHVLNTFTIPDSPDRILNVPADVVCDWDITGSITIGGSWSLPISVNQLSLPGAHLPFNQDVSVSSAMAVNLEGDVTISSEFNVRVRRTGPTKVRFGVYRKHGSEFDASFTASAGITAVIDGKDLISRFFKAIDPAIDPKSIAPDDLAKIGSVLKSSIDRSLALSLSAACSASSSDEAAIVYEIDTSAASDSTSQAVADALKGDWKPLSELSSAKKLRNVIIDTVEKKTSLSINILGLYNYKSVADFVHELRVVQDQETGSVLITDNLTATQITTASTPLAANPDKLAAALYQSFIVTAAYQALLAATSAGVSTRFTAQQELLVYQEKLDYLGALKQLNVGQQLGVVPVTLKSTLPSSGDAVHQARFTAKAMYGSGDFRSVFFSDVEKLTPRVESDVKGIGRKVLAALLDPQNSVDHSRIVTLQSDALWAQLENNPAAASPSHADWFDIATWADAIVAVAPPLADTIRAARSISGDPSLNPDFMKKRAALAHALEGVAHNLHAAYEKGFPLCVMAALCGNRTGEAPPTYSAGWNSKTIFTNAVSHPAASITQAAAL